MKERKETVITLNPATHTATITATDAYEIKHFIKAAEAHPHWTLGSMETNQRGKVTRVQYTLPAADIRFKSAISDAELQRMRQSIAQARTHQQRHTYTC